MKKLLKFLINKSVLSPFVSYFLLLFLEPYISGFCRKSNFINTSIANSIAISLFTMMFQVIFEYILYYFEHNKINMKLIISEKQDYFNINSPVKLDLSKSHRIYLEVRLDGYKKYVKGNEVINIFFPENVDIDLDSSRKKSFFEIEGNDLKINLNEIFQKDQKEIRNYGHVIKLSILPNEEVINSTGVTVEISSSTSKKCKKKKIKLQGNYEMFTITKGGG